MEGREDIRDSRYAPPYPQEFYSFWPKHVVKAGGLVVLVLIVAVALSYYYMFPSDVNMPPLPDEGTYIPGPEWYLLVLFLPFWYFPGEEWALVRSIFTFWLPLLFLVFLLLVPFIFDKRWTPGERLPKAKKVALAVGVGVFFVISAVVFWRAGSPAKVYGCMSCHNPMMGARQALPPAKMGEYYRVERKRQIEVGKYRAGKTVGEEMTLAIGGVETYKDANWQLRHMYEPTMTW